MMSNTKKTKIALLQCGFIRDMSHMSRMRSFIHNNSEFEIDVYLQTYNIIGVDEKFVRNRGGYLSSDRTDIEEINRICPIKNFQILDPIATEKKAKARNPTLINAICQFQNVFDAMQMIDTKQYDGVIRSRPDYFIKHMRLKNYDVEKILTSNLLLAKLKSGKILKKAEGHLKQRCLNFLLYDGFALGGVRNMEKYCDFINQEVFSLKRNGIFAELELTNYISNNLKLDVCNINDKDLLEPCIWRKLQG